jgi:hypothetical protein
MVELSVLEIMVEDNLPAFFLVQPDFYRVFFKHKASGSNFSVHIGKDEKPQPNPYQRISREEGQDGVIYILEKEIFKRLNINKESSGQEKISARSIMLTELESDFRKILKIL